MCHCVHNLSYTKITSFSLTSKASNHEYSLYTQLVFTQGLLNSYCWLPALSFSFICPHKQFDEYSWSRIFVVSPFQGIYHGLIVVCVFWTHSLFSLTFLSPFFFILMIFIFVAFGYRFNVKRCYTVSIFITIFMIKKLKIISHPYCRAFIRKITYIHT